MNPVVKIAGALKFVANHPLNRDRKFRAVAEYGFLKIAARITPGDVCVECPNHTRLMVSPHMKGAAHFITPRLCEFDDMSSISATAKLPLNGFAPHRLSPSHFESLIAHGD